MLPWDFRALIATLSGDFHGAFMVLSCGVSVERSRGYLYYCAAMVSGASMVLLWCFRGAYMALLCFGASNGNSVVLFHREFRGASMEAKSFPENFSGMSIGTSLPAWCFHENEL